MSKYSQAVLTAAFEMVEDSTNWKNPIDATVKLNEGDFDVIQEAVIHFTGSVPRFSVVNKKEGLYRVQAAGYYEAIGI
jgi:hypothetical protein